MLFKSEPLELRGIINRQSSNGNVYYLMNCEDKDGSPLQFYVKDISAFPDNLKKGDSVVLSCSYRKYKREERLTVVRVDKEA